MVACFLQAELSSRRRTGRGGRSLVATAAIARTERRSSTSLHGVCVFGVSNQRYLRAANVQLTAYALTGFPVEVERLVGTSRRMGRWAQ